MAAIITATAHGLAVGDIFNARNLGGTGYNGIWTVKQVAGTTIYYLTGGANESATSVAGGSIDRNGIYQTSGNTGDWSLVGNFGTTGLAPLRDPSVGEAASRNLASGYDLDRLLAPALTPRKQVVTAGQLVTLQADSLVPGSTPKFYADGVLVGYGGRTPAGPRFSCAWQAPASPNYNVTITVAAEVSRIGSGSVVVAEANRIATDLTTWAKTNIASVTGGYSDPDGGNNAYRVLCAASAVATTHSISATANPVSAGPNSSLEVWVNSTSVVAIVDAGNFDVAYVNVVTGETWSKFVNVHIMERRGPWARIWWSQKNGGTPASQFFLHVVAAIGNMSNTTIGTETALFYQPRAIDGVLPFDNYQKAAIRIGSVAYADRWLVRSEFVDTVATQSDINVDVVVPTSYDPTKRYPVLYVLEVESTPGNNYLDGLQTLKGMGVHDTYQVILARCYFPSSVSWYTSKSDGTAQHDVFVRDVVTKLVDDRYSTIRSREGRLMIGFSKSGWGGVSLLLRNPSVFGYVAAWDVPFGLQYSGQDNYTFDAFGAPKQFGNGLVHQTATGSQAQYSAYNPAEILAANVAAVNDRTRMVLGGSVVWYGDVKYFRGLCDANGVPYAFRSTPEYVTDSTDHNWVPNSHPASAWLGQMVGMLMRLR